LEWILFLKVIFQLQIATAKPAFHFARLHYTKLITSRNGIKNLRMSVQMIFVLAVLIKNLENVTVRLARQL